MRIVVGKPTYVDTQQAINGFHMLDADLVLGKDALQNPVWSSIMCNTVLSCSHSRSIEMTLFKIIRSAGMAALNLIGDVWYIFHLSQAAVISQTSFLTEGLASFGSARIMSW